MTKTVEHRQDSNFEHTVHHMNAPTVPITPFMQSVDDYIRAGYQSLTVNTTELRRVEEELFQMAEIEGLDYDAVLTWDCVDGFKVRAINKNLCTPKQQQMLGQQLKVTVKLPAGATGPSEMVTNNPLTALKYSLTGLHDFPFQNCLIIYRNLHVPLAADINVAQFWQTSVNERQFNTELTDPTGRDKTKTVIRRRMPIIIGTATNFSNSIRPTVTTVEYSLPGPNYMRRLFEGLDNTVRMQADPDAEPLPPRDDPEVVKVTEAAIRLLLGLSAVEASDAVALCAVRHENLCYPEILDTIEHQKVEILQSATSLQYVHRSKIGNENDIGGFQAYKAWIKLRGHCYSRAGQAKGLDAPRGVVMIGVPGTAKSVSAKITARILDLPLIKLDVGAIFGSLVGQSEQRMADTIRTIEAMRGAVVLIDEADKLWGGADQASGDSGVTRRVFGKFLSWMAEKQDGSFVIMTINRTNGLPPEFLRRGRFDEIWYTDMPEVGEREQILRIHMRLRGLDMDQLLTQKDLDEVLEITDKFVGAEIEEVVKEARLAAFADGARDPNKQDLINAANTIVPLSKLDPEGIAAIQTFCDGRARPVQPKLQEESQKPIIGQRSMQTKRAKPTT